MLYISMNYFILMWNLIEYWRIINLRVCLDMMSCTRIVCIHLGFVNKQGYKNYGKTKIFLMLPSPCKLNTNRLLLNNLQLVSFDVT